MADCIREPAQWDRVLPIGGPGEALSALQQGEMLFDILGQKPRFIQVPVALFDAIIGFLDFLASLFAGMKDTAEFGRIGKYYAVESMLVMDPATGRYDADATPSYGKDTLRCAAARPRALPALRAARSDAHSACAAGASSSAWPRTAWRAKSWATPP
jgi:divinyl chlorophyllide a 8-vinyl-reductase